MPWRYDVFVTPVAGRWRVSVLDAAAAVLERVCDLADHEAALQFARSLAEDMVSLGDQVTLHST
ncbi:hypothetical protein [Tahibacter harae]|uniref:DUF1902 domain-containing protein n=1 Tax=Tahibacter harae TaxID=2963937 RepID=A0ABT1QQ82_9GAMM|nr:hypothetical protein [Tahibacter harae]MCQ4164458.1 hypothetical protein [Tahibacter harae]